MTAADMEYEYNVLRSMKFKAFEKGDEEMAMKCQKKMDELDFKFKTA